MVKQQSSHWSSETKDMNYFFRQLENPYQSTISFFDFLDENQLINANTSLVDACCGSGCNAFYAAKRFSPKMIVGFDYQDEFLEIAREYQSKEFNGSISRIDFCKGDVYDVKPTIDELNARGQLFNANGIIFLQTLSWLTDWKKALQQLSSLNTEWIALSSLFYEGLIEAEISIKRYSSDGNNISASPYDVSPYNVYSMPIVEDFLKENGFVEFFWRKFDIKSPLKKPADVNKMGTYTIEEKSGSLLQVSGPIIMPWQFLIAKR